MRRFGDREPQRGSFVSALAQLSARERIDRGRDELGTVVIVHDYLTQRGGAERVVLEMAKLWPAAPIYTSLYRPASTFDEFRELEVHASPLDALPVDRGFRRLFPLYPFAFWMLGPTDADVVISHSTGWAHLVRTTERGFHAVYCHTPPRWLWTQEYGGSSAGERFITPIKPALRRWDACRAQRPDMYIAGSASAQARIRAAYGREAPIVHPPVGVDGFSPTPRGERLLVVSRLLPYKRIDLAVDAATRSGIGLDIVGGGPSLDKLRERAGPTVAFLGHVDDAALRELYSSCRAVCVMGQEDFGIVAIEAQAAGKPVIAYGAGGALETVTDGVTGVLFDRQDVDAVIDAIRRCDALEIDEAAQAASAARFAPIRFQERFVEALRSGRQAHAAEVAARSSTS